MEDDHLKVIVEGTPIRSNQGQVKNKASLFDFKQLASQSSSHNHEHSLSLTKSSTLFNQLNDSTQNSGRNQSLETKQNHIEPSRILRNLRQRKLNGLNLVLPQLNENQSRDDGVGILQFMPHNTIGIMIMTYSDELSFQRMRVGAPMRQLQIKQVQRRMFQQLDNQFGLNISPERSLPRSQKELFLSNIKAPLLEQSFESPYNKQSGEYNIASIKPTHYQHSMSYSRSDSSLLESNHPLNVKTTVQASGISLAGHKDPRNSNSSGLSLCKEGALTKDDLIMMNSGILISVAQTPTTPINKLKNRSIRLQKKFESSKDSGLPQTGISYSHTVTGFNVQKLLQINQPTKQ